MPIKQPLSLKINLSREPTTFDPRKIFDPSHEMLVSLLYEGLFRLNADLSVEPAQAKSFAISEDRLTYTFFLADHLWSDQTEVTAFDFSETFLDLLRPEFPAPHASLLYDIAGAEDAKKGIVPISEVGIKAINQKTLQIRLKRPNPCFTKILASAYLSPICKTHETKNPDWAVKNSMISNGPFELVKWTPQSEILLKKSRSYRGKNLPKIDEILISLIGNELSALHMYASQELDLLGSPFSHIPLPFLKDLSNQKALTVKPVAASIFIGFNTESPLFKNPEVRKAFAQSIDRKKIVEHVTQLDEELGLSPIPSVLKKKPPRFTLKDAEGPASKELLEKNWSGSKEITLYFWPLEVNYLLAQTLQQQWKENLGVDVQIKMIDFKTLLTHVEKKTYDMALFAWSADYADPLALLQRFRTASDPLNYCHWEDSAFTALLDQSSFEENPEKRSLLLEEAEKILIDQMPIAPIFHWHFSLLIQPTIQGFDMDPLGHIQFSELYR